MHIISYYKNPYEHSGKDTSINIDYDFLEKATKASLAVVMDLANSK